MSFKSLEPKRKALIVILIAYAIVMPGTIIISAIYPDATILQTGITIAQLAVSAFFLFAVLYVEFTDSIRSNEEFQKYR